MDEMQGCAQTRDVTVVIATRNRWPDLQHSLPRHEAPVILVDNASTDGTPDRVRARFPGVEVIELPENAGAVARNIGVAVARTPYVAFADDSWWSPASLARRAGPPEIDRPSAMPRLTDVTRIPLLCSVARSGRPDRR